MKPNYLGMIRLMGKGKRREWSVYILRCGDDSLYTGIAKNVDMRIEQHNSGKGAAYTRTRRPVKLTYQENGLTRGKALVREAEIKAMPRPKKLAFAGSMLNRGGLSVCKSDIISRR